MASDGDKGPDQPDRNPWGAPPASGGGTRPPVGGDKPPAPANPWGDPESKGSVPPGRGNKLEDILRKPMFGGAGGPGGERSGGPNMPTFRAGGIPYKLIGFGFLALWLWTAVHQIGPQQEGVVTRFGSYARTVQPGIALTMPLPFESMTKVNVREMRTENIPGAGVQENLVLTGDANIINLAYSVRWSIKSPAQYLFQIEKQTETIRAVAESAMRASVANYTLAQAIGPGREAIAADVAKRMQQVLDGYNSGIRIDGVTLRNSDAPAAVDDAFKQVNAAKQQAESYMNEARADAERVLRRAEGDAAAFDRIYEQYRLAPEVTRRRIYFETMESVLQRTDKAVVPNSGVTSYLPLPEIRRADARAGQAAQPAQTSSDQGSGSAAKAETK